MPTTTKENNQFVAVDLSVDNTTNIQIYKDWLNLLVDSLFSVVGENCCFASCVKDSGEISIRVNDILTRVEARRVSNHLCGVASENGDSSLAKPKHISINGLDISALKVVNGKTVKVQDAKTDHRSKTGQNRFNKDAHALTVALGVNGQVIGFLDIWPFDHRPVLKENPRFLQQRAFEITTALRMLWELMTVERNRLESIVNGLIDGVILINDNGDILVANPSARKLLGLRRRTSGTMENLKQARHVDITPLLAESIQKRYDVQNRIKKIESLQKILGINIKRLFDRDGTHLGWMVILRDITASWEMDKLRTEFVAQVSHELHSPLTAIQEGVSLILEEKVGNLNDSQRHCLQVTKESVDRLGRLVDNLLKITRLEIAEPELERRNVVQMNRLLKSLVTTYQWIADKKRIVIKKALPNNEINIRADRDKISQILTNFLDNALKFTPEKGKIEVGLREEEEVVELWVKDSGMGVPYGEQKKIFTKFYRVENEINRKTKGYGLGLSIVKEIVTHYGGRIWVESRPNEGSTFFVQLPKTLPGK